MLSRFFLHNYYITTRDYSGSNVPRVCYIYNIDKGYEDRYLESAFIEFGTLIYYASIMKNELCQKLKEHKKIF